MSFIYIDMMTHTSSRLIFLSTDIWLSSNRKLSSFFGNEFLLLCPGSTATYKLFCVFAVSKITSSYFLFLISLMTASPSILPLLKFPEYTSPFRLTILPFP